MAAYGVIGGIIGGAIALAITPLLRKKLKKNSKIILHNDEVYSFPIGWCKDKARDEIARYKRIKPWE